MPELLSLGRWAPPLIPLLLGPRLKGVKSSGLSLLVFEDETDDTPRLRVLNARLLLLVTEDMGEPRGGVVLGAGNFERTDCTRASRRCIWAVRVRMWLRDVDGGNRFPGPRLPFVPVDRGAVVVRIDEPVEPVAAARAVVGREVEVAGLDFGVTLGSNGGNLDAFLGLVGAGVMIDDALGLDLGRDTDASDIGGDGGSLTWILVEDMEDSGGVVVSGELAPDTVLVSNMGLSGMESSVETMDIWRCCSCFFSLSCRISASILRSESSSRSRCVSILSCSRSCSPILISSSIMTTFSIAALYLDSMSSRDESVIRACRSKSSFATSISRSLCCSVRFVSLKVVISFSRVFCAAFASAFDSLYFLCGDSSQPWRIFEGGGPILPSTHQPQSLTPPPSP